MKKRFINFRLPTGGDSTENREILVVDGRIAEVAPPGEGSGTDDAEILDLGGNLLLPGVIDGHVHFDDPGFTHRENFETGTRAAAAGGVTCVVDMPCTSLPPVTSVANLQAKLDVIRPKAHVDFMLWGGVSRNAMGEEGWRENLEELVDAGVASIKIYMLSGMETFQDLSPRPDRGGPEGGLPSRDPGWGARRGQGDGPQTSKPPPERRGRTAPWPTPPPDRRPQRSRPFRPWWSCVGPPGPGCTSCTWHRAGPWT